MKLAKFYAAVDAVLGAKAIPFRAGKYKGFHVEAPDHHRWVDGGCYSMRVEWLDHLTLGKMGSDDEQRAAIHDAIERIACGVRPATLEECEEAGEEPRRAGTSPLHGKPLDDDGKIAFRGQS